MCLDHYNCDGTQGIDRPHDGDVVAGGPDHNNDCGGPGGQAGGPNSEGYVCGGSHHDPFQFDQATTVLGHAIRVRGSDLYRALDIIPQKVAFGLHELAVAVEHGVGATDLAAILDRSKVDPTATWRDRRTTRANTLALVAALAANPDALQLLLAHGSDPSIGRRSVLDELLPTEQTDADREVLRLLLAHGERPYLPSTRVELLFGALFFGAPMDVIEALIDRVGGALPERAILTLAAAPNEQALAVAKTLGQHYDLDLHFIDERGRNAVSEAVSLFWDTQLNSVVVDENVARWLTFLADNSVAMKPDGGGMDPLDIVLLEMLRRPATNRAGVRVARFLIDHGAPVGASHQDLVEEIALADWDGYRRLMQEVPELRQAPM